MPPAIPTRALSGRRRLAAVDSCVRSYTRPGRQAPRIFDYRSGALGAWPSSPRLPGIGAFELQREIEIDAPPSAIWAVLTDFDSYPDWNPFLRRVRGQLRQGARLSVRCAPPGARALTYIARITALDAERELRWVDRFAVSGVFDGEHSFRIEPRGERRSRFVQAERFSGLLVVRGFNRTRGKTELGLEQMNAAIKMRVEQGPGAQPSGEPRAGTRRRLGRRR